MILIRSTRLSRSVLWALFVVLGFLLGTAAQLAAAEPAKPLAERIQAGPVKLIVMLRADTAGIAVAQERLAARLRDRGHTLSGWHAYSSLPAVAMEADASLYATLAADPEVESIEEDRLARPHADDDGHEIGINAMGAWTIGYTGLGRAIAILDTGVDAAHPFLGGRVVAEACFSTSVSFQQVSSLCPNGEGTQIGRGAAAPCAGYSDCAHGTLVAGIAAGFESSNNSGIAPAAQIIAIQVFSRVDDPAVCGGSGGCIRAYTSDRLRALDYVYSLRNTHAIAAVNLSLGSTAYDSQASCDAANLTTKQAVDQLRAVGIASVAATGNEGLRGRVTEPACISSVISVASSLDLDDIEPGSNLDSYVSIMGYTPGIGIGFGLRSSVPGGGFGPLVGTSAAAAQVSGAFAVLSQANSAPSVGDVVATMRSTGSGVNFGRGGNLWGWTGFRRLKLEGTLAALCPDCISPYTGWWWNPNESGRGFAVETRFGRMFIAAYLYDDDGSNVWFVADGVRTGNTLTGLLVKFHFGQSLDGTSRSPRLAGHVGNATLVFSSPTAGTLSWPGGSIPIERFAIDGQSVQAPSAGAPETGWWWNASESGTGWFFEVQSTNMYLAGYYYDATGKPVWYVSGGPMLSANAYDGELRLYEGGQSLTGGYRPPSSYDSIGGISLRFPSRTTATLALPQGRTIPLTRYPVR